MQVVINERQVEYTPAPATDWTFTANDPYMYPVKLNNTDCFIKRFEHGDPSKVTGWGLLKKLKGKNVEQLPRVFDLKEGEAEGRKALYVFMKMIDGGRTLDKISSLGTEQFIRKLANDLLTAFASVHSRGYWIADFCEKNILWDRNGSSYLLDLDSSIPLTDYPRIDMWGSKRYWIPVVESYKLLMGRQDVAWMELDGSCFNYLQLLFMILHFKLRLQEDGQERTAVDLKHLATHLHNHFAVSVNIFQDAFRQGNAFSEAQIDRIKELVEHIIQKAFNGAEKAGGKQGAGERPVKVGRPANIEGTLHGGHGPLAEQGTTASGSTTTGSKVPGSKVPGLTATGSTTTASTISGSTTLASPAPDPSQPANPISNRFSIFDLEKLNKWTGMHLIFGWIIYGVLCCGIALTLFGGNNEVRTPLTVILMLLTFVAIYPLIFLSRFRKKVQETIWSDFGEQRPLEGIEHLNRYFQIASILRIITAVVLVILLVFEIEILSRG